MLITNPTAHSQTPPRSPTPAPTRAPGHAVRPAPVAPVLPVLLAVVTERGSERGVLRLEPLNLARTLAPAVEALQTRGTPGASGARFTSVLETAKEALTQQISRVSSRADVGRAIDARPIQGGTLQGGTLQGATFHSGSGQSASAQGGGSPSGRVFVQDAIQAGVQRPGGGDRPGPILLRTNTHLAPGTLVPLEAHTDGWRIAERSMTPRSLLGTLRPMLATPSATWGELASQLSPMQIQALPSLAAMTPQLLRQIPGDTGAALQLVAHLIRLNAGAGSAGRPSSTELRAEKLVADRMLVLHLLSALVSRGATDTDGWIMETPVRVDERLELLQLQVTHLRHGYADAAEEGSGAPRQEDDEDEWQLRLLFNLDPLGSFGAWLRWSTAAGLSIDCWIESRFCYRVASELQEELHETLDKIGVQRLSLHSGAMPQPVLPNMGGSNVNVTV